MRTSGVIAPRKKRSATLFQLLIAFGLLVAVWFSLGQNVLLPQWQGGTPGSLGETGLTLSNVIEGPQALAQLNKLHGTDIQLASAYIAEYSHTSSPYHNNDEKVTVWVGKTGNGDAAVGLTQRMVERIEKGNTGFSNLRRLDVAGRMVFRVNGPGGEHFFYQSREPESIVWLAIKSDDALSVLTQAVKNF